MERNKAYELLGIEPTDSSEQIRQAYKDLLKVWNPDRFASDPGLRARADKMIQDIDAAFDVAMSRHMSVPTEKPQGMDNGPVDASDSHSRPPEIIQPPCPEAKMVPAVVLPRKHKLLTATAVTVVLLAIAVGSFLNPRTAELVLYNLFATPIMVGWLVATAILIAGRESRIYVWIGCVCLVVTGYLLWLRVRPHVVNVSLSVQDETRMKDIMQHTFMEEGYLSLPVRQEFWAIMDKYGAGPETDSEWRRIREKFTFKATVYDRHFFEDALVSYRTGKPYKSPQRQKDEERLLGDGIDTADALMKSDDFMGKIARREAIAAQGRTIIFDENMIKSVLARLDAVNQRLVTLWTRP